LELDWENLFDDWDGENYWENLAWENCSGPKRSLDDFSNRDCLSVNTDCLAALSKPQSCVLTVLDESEKLDTLQKYDLVPDSMNNPDCELVVC